MSKKIFKLKAKKLELDSGRNPIVFLNKYCPVVLKEGFDGMTRIRVFNEKKSIVAILNVVNSSLVMPEEIGLCDRAYKMLDALNDGSLQVSHLEPITSFSHVRAKMYGRRFTEEGMFEIVNDIVKGKYSDTYIASFSTACEGKHMNEDETAYLTKAMFETGDRINWGFDMVVDKHCIGGVPGNRTTPIVISIVAAHGFYIPKTSSRAITSPSGTADTMEVLAPVEVDVDEMKKIVNKENGCLVWGGSMSISPSDDIIIRVKRDLDIDSEGQMIASIVSKKIAAGSTHILIDIPVGPTAKVRTQADAIRLKKQFEKIGKKLDVIIKVIITDGIQPIGNGIGPALEAKDVLAVLKNDKDAPQDLTEKSILVAGAILEFSPKIKMGQGKKLAKEILDSGKAWEKFKAICDAQGGMRTIPYANYTYDVKAEKNGKIVAIDNRKLSQMAKLAGAPESKVSGVYLYKHLKERVDKGDVVLTIHSDSSGELQLALDLMNKFEIVKIR
jgi:thymidine phosphorylase